MKFWNDELRICSNCKKPVELKGEERTSCPHCQQQVWFFNYAPLKTPPELPPPPPPGLWSNPQTAMLLVCAVILSLIALLGVGFQLVASAIMAIVALGFCIYGYMRHAETQRLEDLLKHASKLTKYAERMRDRVKEVNLRYMHLLKTGDARIQQYFDEIYVQAEIERQEADDQRRRAELDRLAIHSVEQRIYNMAERFVHDHRKW